MAIFNSKPLNYQRVTCWWRWRSPALAPAFSGSDKSLRVDVNVTQCVCVYMIIYVHAHVYVEDTWRYKKYIVNHYNIYVCNVYSYTLYIVYYNLHNIYTIYTPTSNAGSKLRKIPLLRLSKTSRGVAPDLGNGWRWKTCETTGWSMHDE
jgi:hypothetical protein